LSRGIARAHAEVMKTCSTFAITGFALALMCAVSVSARDHSELNGTWTMLPAKSDFAGQSVVQTGTVTIHDADGAIVVSRSFQYEGATQSFFYRDSTDAEHGETFHTGKDLKSKTTWEHNVLVVKTTQSGSVTIESYSLAADGTMIDSVTQPNHKPIVLVFQRR
jgi:hypothetical protein